MSGKTKTGTPRRHPGVRGPRPDRKALRIEEAEARRLKHEADGSTRAKKKRLAEARKR